ncbi:sigma-70 family RNA polymerase sigma factor [Pseudonocardia spinosispora]|uniref:sigma-70 family RNA polymerase sigma factor n=1 Tax=Pseudonocardia spinosispora TaxID=103441 RepID=UPI000492225C|nr:sigma-70 family RNA polymerase sigma factor [Pseudonocardia spinosispora]
MSTVVVDQEFQTLVEPLRRELTVHCYRMLGSVHEAEDLVQETYIRAWRAYHGFENRSSLRTWIYRIATNVCLTALQQNQRRPLPTGLGQPNSDPNNGLIERPELPWLEPLPDSMVWGNADPDPAEAAITRDSVRLAFVAALHHLTAQQRAVVILRDVLAWRASEVAAALDITVAAVNSTLQRARAQLAKQRTSTHPDLPDGDERATRLLADYLDAFEHYDVPRIVALLTEDAVWEMPPFTGWYLGRTDIGVLIGDQCPAKTADDMRFLPSSANGQPVLAVYMRGEDGEHHAFQLQQLTLTEAGVSHVACYFDTTLFSAFGLPSTLPRER